MNKRSHLFLFWFYPSVVGVEIHSQHIVRYKQQSYSTFMTDRKHIPTLSTSRLTLRPFSLEDSASLHRIMNEPNIMQYFPNPDPPEMDRVQNIIENQLTHWEAHNLGWWAVVPRGDKHLIGWNGLQYLPETDEVEVAYLLGKQSWGRGYATEAARASLAFEFETLGLRKIIGLTHPKNIASQKVLLKCGLKYIEQKVYFGLLLNRYLISK